MRLNFLSDNLILILTEIVNHQIICKLLYYNHISPLQQTNLTLPLTSLIRTKIFPYPFNINVTIEDCSQLMIYYPNGDFKDNVVIENNELFMDIVVAKNLWLINNNNKSLIRPYEIMKELINIFNKNISTVGRLKFTNFYHIGINEKFDCVRLVCKMITVGS